ncbi:MAG: hypothetical protein HDT33_02790 [Clostridiales bacterium]|nr:hypothetical protein [Clostridiales bacterium]
MPINGAGETGKKGTITGGSADSTGGGINITYGSNLIKEPMIQSHFRLEIGLDHLRSGMMHPAYGRTGWPTPAPIWIPRWAFLPRWLFYQVISMESASAASTTHR